MRRLIIGLFTAIVVFILFVVLCTFVRRPYEAVLLDRFGALIPEAQQTRIMYNWYLKSPFDGLVRVDTRLHLRTLPLKEFVTAKKEPVNVRTFAVWRIVDPVAFRQKASGSDDVAEQIIEQRILGLVGQSMGKHSLDEFFNVDPKTDENTRAIEIQIAHDATNGSADHSVPGLKELGVEIADIGFSRMAFPPGNTDAIYQRMVADLNEASRNYESTGIAQANIARSEGERKAQEIRAEATAQAEQIRGQGDRESLEILAAVAQTENAREFYQYWKSLDFWKSSLTKNTVFVISSDHSWFKNLFQAPQGSGIMAPPPATATQPAGK